MLDVSDTGQARSRREWPYREREDGYTGRERMLGVGDVGQTGELPGLAIQGDKMLDVSDVCGRGVGGSGHMGRQDAGCR